MIFLDVAAWGEGYGHHAGDVEKEGEEGGEDEVVQRHQERLEYVVRERT